MGFRAALQRGRKVVVGSFRNYTQHDTQALDNVGNFQDERATQSGNGALGVFKPG